LQVNTNPTNYKSGGGPKLRTANTTTTEGHPEHVEMSTNLLDDAEVDPFDTFLFEAARARFWSDVDRFGATQHRCATIICPSLW